MEEADVVRIVDSSVAKKNQSLLASMKSMLESSLTDLKRSHCRFSSQRDKKNSSSTSRIDLRRKETRTSIGSILGLVTLLKKPRKPAHPNSSKFQPAQ